MGHWANCHSAHNIGIQQSQRKNTTLLLVLGLWEIAFTQTKIK